MIKTKHRYKKVMHIWAASLLISCMLTACGGGETETAENETVSEEIIKALKFTIRK